MKPSWISKASIFLTLILPTCGASVASGRAVDSAPSPANQSQTASSPFPPQQLSPAGQASLQTIIKAGGFADLRWPNFSDYRAHIQKFYDSYAGALPWVRGMRPTPQAQQVIAILLNAESKGLSADDYDGPRWTERLAKFRPAAANHSAPSENDAVLFDVALTVCAMRYISDLHIGKVNPKHFEFGFDTDARKYDLPEFLREHVIDASDVAAVLAQIEPPYPGYQRTLRALQTYVQLARQDDAEPLPPVTKPIAPGDSYAGVPRLIRLLRQLGDLPPDATFAANPLLYQEPLVDAVKNSQRRYGRTPDGRITATTVADLNVPLATRVREMQLTLERWRWLPVILHAAPIVANIPEFRLRAYDENFKVALTMDVQVGRSYDHDTPVFTDNMEYAVFRPYWNVPYSIARSELIPHIARDPNYLSAKGFQVVDSRQTVVTSGAVTSDMLEQLRSGKLFIRQNAGPKNSLGLVKFIFPNSYNIYMHDTPEQSYFSRARRDDSHGCIRLEHPADLAVWVLRDNPGWDMDHVRAAMNGDNPNHQVNLAHPIPVLIVYATVIVTEDGLVHFYDDIYGHDAALERVLQQGYPFPN
jgi:L,D-transpeptidase YcbB